MNILVDLIKQIEPDDIASMPPGMLAMCQRMTNQPITHKTPKTRNMYYPTGAFVVKLGPNYASMMTERARQLLVLFLWLDDFKWARGSTKNGFSTHVHFGYSETYGKHRRLKQQLDSMWFDSRSVLHYPVCLKNTCASRCETISFIEIPFDPSSYTIVRSGRQLPQAPCYSTDQITMKQGISA